MEWRPEDLRRMRRDANLTQSAVADALGLSIPYVSRLERGDARCPAPLAAAWADACGWELSVRPKDDHLGQGLSPVDRGIVQRFAAALPLLSPDQRATALHLLDLWERVAEAEVARLAAERD